MGLLASKNSRLVSVTLHIIDHRILEDRRGFVDHCMQLRADRACVFLLVRFVDRLSGVLHSCILQHFRLEGT